MTVLLVRHAHAGDRSAWTGDDRLRPLSPRGETQARKLVGLLNGYAPTRVLSSPYVRCVQSVEPLADHLGVAVEEDDRLAEGTPFDRIQQLLRQVSADGDAVLCSHGDVIGAVVTDLLHRGALTPDAARWAKGSVWVLDGLPDHPRGRYLPPPA